jgi:hypothetical protein
VKPFILVLLVIGTASAGRRVDTFIGVVTDDVCAKDGHSGMQMGPTDAECTRLCVMVHDAAYALYDGKTVYKLIGSSEVEAFAAQKVRVVGTLDTGMQAIRVDSIAAAE